MKKLISMLICSVFLCCTPVYAIPTLQLDIGGGTYDSVTETIVTNASSFTLYTLLTPKENIGSEDLAALLADTYYISAAVTPKVETPVDLGSFEFDGDTIAVTDDLAYGIPPTENDMEFDPHDLNHGDFFPTYFGEFAFQFEAVNTVDAYNAQDDTGQYADTLGGTGAYYAAISVDISNLAAGYNLHFDLYNTEFAKKDYTDIDIDSFAPFSHDAETRTPTPVPEPATLFLFGTGLLGFGGFVRKVQKG